METTNPTTTTHHHTKDNTFFTGLGLVAFTFLVYLFMGDANAVQSPNFPAFIFVNYIATLSYLMLIMGIGKQQNDSFFKPNPYHYTIFLTLATISCFSLNEGVNVFDDFSLWVDVYVMVMYLSLIAFCFIEKLPPFIRIIVFAGLGLGTTMAGYFTFYLLPLTPLGFIGSFVFGLSLHLIVPALVLIKFIFFYYKTEKTIPEKWAYGLGAGTPLVITLLFIMQWNNTKNIIQSAYASYDDNATHALPRWINISQQLSDGLFTQRILKGGLIYTSFDNWGSWNAISTNMNEKKEHDPLVAIATALSGNLPLDYEERLKILQFWGEERHDTHRKLWSGKNLITENISSKIQVYPEFRLAYSEYLLTIKNKHSWTQEEALYSFELPEGSVASSLSLWVNGVEEQSRLTTRGKADSAYVAIVGVERRDPALLHWQEGNRVTVTVFPCTQKEDRIFKIGFTSPMQLKNQQLFLPQITFEGPYSYNATQKHQVEFPTQPNYQYDIDYHGNLSCAESPLSNQHFSFNNKTFGMEKQQNQLSSFDPTTIYLDINKSWTETEFKDVCELYKNKAIYVYNTNQVKEFKSPTTELFRELQQNNFSLLPIDLVSRFDNVLIVSKSTAKSPNLSDLKETYFGKTLIKSLQEKTNSINFYNLSDVVSPYLKTLKEFHVFNYAEGSVDELKQLVLKQQFPSTHPSKNAIDLTTSKTTLFIQADEGQFESKAPDHLMRLFSYNQLLKKVGRGYFQSGYENEELIAIASEAHIVTPISSMIVLETVKDYERFDIEENEESLGNASDKKHLKNATNNNSGAVPEPHEWAFILLITLGLLGLSAKRFF